MTVEEFVVGTYFPHLTRLASDFSPAYLRRELDFVATSSPQTIFLGDSVLWGYRVQPEQTAIAILRSRGCECLNLAFKAGNPPSYYALTRLFLHRGIRPRAVVLELNQKVLNESDDYYQTLDPAVATLADPLLTSDERAALIWPRSGNSIAQRIDRALAGISLMYAMRTDIRETFFGDAAAPPMRRLTPDLLAGTYDMVPLSQRNVGVRFLEKTADLLRNAGIPVLAFLTPTNHLLLHEYIDNSHYRANAIFLREVLEGRGIRVLDLDSAFPAREFLDEAHLTPAGQRRLASVLASALRDALRQ